MERRQLLKGLGIAAGVGVGGFALHSLSAPRRDGSESATGSSTATPTPTPTPGPPSVRHADEFDTVVDAVAAGADPTGSTPINDVVETHAADDTLLAFPDGTYRLLPLTLSGYTNFGITAAHGTRPRFVSSAGHCLRGGQSYVGFTDVTDFLLDAVSFDFEADGSGGVVRVQAAGDSTVRDVSVAGSCAEQVALFRIDVVDPNGTGVVENLRVTNRDADPTLTGIYVSRDHAGEVTFRDCAVRGFSDNGLYASAPGLDDGQGGPVHVEGGTYRNNNISNVRLGSVGSTARNVRSVNDGVPPTEPGGATVNARGFRLRNGQKQLIENCVVLITRDSGFTYGGIVFHQRNGGATVRDTHVQIDRNTTRAIRAFPTDREGADPPLFERVEITGTADHGETVLIDGRDGTVFRNCTVSQSGGMRRGIRLRNSADCRFVDTHIDVGRTPLTLENATATLVNTTLVTPAGTRHVEEQTVSDGVVTVGADATSDNRTTTGATGTATGGS